MRNSNVSSTENAFFRFEGPRKDITGLLPRIRHPESFFQADYVVSPVLYQAYLKDSFTFAQKANDSVLGGVFLKLMQELDDPGVSYSCFVTREVECNKLTIREIQSSWPGIFLDPSSSGIVRNTIGIDRQVWGCLSASSD